MWKHINGSFMCLGKTQYEGPPIDVPSDELEHLSSETSRPDGRAIPGDELPPT